jgi:hypothetical protein
MRTAGIAGLLVGLSSVVLLGWFWAGVVLIHISFAVLLIDLWLERELFRIWKIAATFIVLLIAGAFSWGFVFVPAPLAIQATITDGAYPPGTNLNGIVWRQGFTELRVDLYNQSIYNYDNVSVVIQPTEPIAAIAQRTTIPGVLFYDAKRLHTGVIQFNSGKQTAIPAVIVATDAGYLMHCERLPAHTSIEIEIALAEIKWNPPAQPAPQLPSEDKNFTLRIKFDDGSTYWLGYPDGDVYLPARPSTQTVKVEGTYDAAFRGHAISEKVQMSGIIPLNLR